MHSQVNLGESSNQLHCIARSSPFSSATLDTRHQKGAAAGPARDDKQDRQGWARARHPPHPRPVRAPPLAEEHVADAATLQGGDANGGLARKRRRHHPPHDADRPGTVGAGAAGKLGHHGRSGADRPRVRAHVQVGQRLARRRHVTEDTEDARCVRVAVDEPQQRVRVAAEARVEGGDAGLGQAVVGERGQPRGEALKAAEARAERRPHVHTAGGAARRAARALDGNARNWGDGGRHARRIAHRRHGQLRAAAFADQSADRHGGTVGWGGRGSTVNGGGVRCWRGSEGG